MTNMISNLNRTQNGSYPDHATDTFNYNIGARHGVASHAQYAHGYRP
jgi:hypothetical protein